MFFLEKVSIQYAFRAREELYDLPYCFNSQDKSSINVLTKNDKLLNVIKQDLIILVQKEYWI